MKSNDEKFQLRLPKSLLRLIRKQAACENLSVSAWLRQLIVDYLRELQEERK